MLPIGDDRRQDALGHGEVSGLEAASGQVAHLEPSAGNEVMPLALDVIGTGHP